MDIVVVIAACAIIGAVLYLPFLLWFRFSNRGRQQRTASPRLTSNGLVANVVVVLAMFAAFAWYETHRGPGSHGALYDGVILKTWLVASVLGTLVQARLGGPQTASVPAAAPSADPPAASAPTPAPETPAAAGLPPGFAVKVSFGRVPVYVHWRFLVAGAFTGLVAGTDLNGFLTYCAAYAFLFAIHEAAHAIAAHRLGLRVYAIKLMGHGGLCVVQVPRDAGHTFQVYIAGLAAQGLVLAATLAVVAIAGPPTTSQGVALVTTFTWVNAMLIAVNLIPRTESQGQRSDGTILWGLHRHVRHGAPHPLAARHAESPVFAPATRLLTVAGMAPDGFVHGIEMLNDDTSPMELVIEMLERHVALDRAAAIAAMLEIHRRGGLLLPLPTRAAAEVVAEAITRESRARGHSLVCRAVSAAD